MLDWNEISKNESLSEDFIRENKDKLTMRLVLRYSQVSESFLEEYYMTFTSKEWRRLSKYQTISEDFIAKHEDQVVWKSICEGQVLSEPFIEEYWEHIDVAGILLYQNLSESFLRKHTSSFEKDEWQYLSSYQNLSEMFIEEFQNQLDWKGIARSQHMSYPFAKRFAKRLDLYYLQQNEKCNFSKEEIKRLEDEQLSYLL